MIDAEDDYGHVGFETFGLPQQVPDPNRPGHYIVREPPKPLHDLLPMVHEGLDSFDAQLVLREEYEQAYGLFDYEDAFQTKQHPLALVRLHPKENTEEYGAMYRIIDRYRVNNIKETFGLSLTEFLNLPHDFVERLFMVCHEQAKKRTPELDKALRELEKGDK